MIRAQSQSAHARMMRAIVQSMRVADLWGDWRDGIVACRPAYRRRFCKIRMKWLYSHPGAWRTGDPVTPGEERAGADQKCYRHSAAWWTGAMIACIAWSS